MLGRHSVQPTRSSCNAQFVHFLQEAYDPAFGARPLRRYLERKVVTELSKLLVQGKIDENSTVYIDVAPGGKELQFTVRKDGGVGSAAGKNKDNDVVKASTGGSAKAVKKMRLDDMDDLMDEE